ncbi:DUF5694 domain-containing protein [Hymenobacter tibetensis]|uniref:DUF5694 domain-containing protein n=1 Tax=Hymenobacter tibetensis TaxID=497967 RepID=A0ABY4D580_9BACT|nr:DUF5694 domain-containing protein [Hymenobacter tibetensis]UOG75128.1 DUF5694 domain-containing protein [Hymenobacter tibetensis]
MKTLSLLVALLSTTLLGGTCPAWAQASVAAPPATKIKVYLLGTFHFNGSTTDVVKGSKSDMQTPTRQQELEDLANKLTKTKADKVFVEWKQNRQSYVDSTYALYRQNQFKLGNNEVFQVGYRLAAKLNRSRVYCADAEGVFDYGAAMEYAKEHNQADILKNDGKSTEAPSAPDSIGRLITARYHAIYGPEHPAPKGPKKPLTITDIIISNNTPAAERSNMDWYLLTGARVGGGTNYVGADLAGEFYKRNMRIYTNMLRAVDFQKDRSIILIIGAGHVSFLKEQLLHNSLLEVQEVLPLLKAK